MDFFKGCPICQRTYSQENRYARHVRYCRKAKDQRKGRPKSCLACSASKVKCTFTTPCSRCEQKGLNCVYQDGGGRVQQQGTYRQQQQKQQQEYDMAWVDGSWMDFPGANTNFAAGSSVLSGDGQPFVDTIGTSLNFQLDDSILLQDAAGAMLTPSSLDSLATSTQELSLWLPPVPSAGRVVTDLTHLRQGSPHLKHIASLITHMASSFPQMMLRRSTFPPFIHPRWHEAELPDAIAACMAIAQLYVSRTPETRGFLWKTIMAEQKRFNDEVMISSTRDIHSAMQAIMIYVLMAVVDRDADTPRRGTQLVQTAAVISARFRQLVKGEFYSMTEEQRPSPNWEEWIFAESRRRMTSLWYILSRVIAIDAEIPCDGCPPADDLPAPSARTLWEARSREEWAVEKMAYDAGKPITTLGDLARCRGAGRIVESQPLHTEGIDDAVNWYDTSAQQRLMNWEAGGDKLSVMLNIVTEFN